MKKIVAVVLSLLVVMALVPQTLANGVVNVYNWEDYISEDALKLFEEETGITVNYMRFTTNEDMMVQVRTSPGAFDVVFPSDYCIEKLISEDLLEELDYSKIPNAKHMSEWVMNPDFDPNSKHSIAYMWGTVGILYDKTKVNGPIDSWEVLFTDEYKGEIFMLDSIRDAFAVALKYLGYSLNSKNPKELNEAAKLLIDQKKQGIVKAYQVDETKDKMVAGEGVLAVVYSGDAQYSINLNDNLAYSIPKEGSNVWVDSLVIPKSSQNKENAYKFIDFLCRPDVAQMNCEYIEYSSPNAAAIELMGEEYINNPNLNPPQETIDNCEYFHDLKDFLSIYNTLWAQVKNAK
ncbi:MAG: spermidine/putrescine ABC transporter substrate-binding protein [Eubacteriales bacterium]|nr:spermidine/putrescine ABC transporter substrate-binding protein [Eubacteriales bacterium]